MFPSFDWFLLLGLLMGVIRGHDHHRRPCGGWQQLHHLPLDEVGRQGQLDWSRASLDSSSVRAKPGGGA